MKVPGFWFRGSGVTIGTVVSVTRFYRASLWLPVALPVVVILAMDILLKGLGVEKVRGPLSGVLQILAYSLIYGGLPYICLAFWATWWIGDREERQVRRLMLVAPLLMVVSFCCWCLLVGLAVDRFRVWLAVAALGSVISILLGYAYVLLTLLLRLVFRNRLQTQAILTTSN